jgi:hypothetical protein
MEITDNPLVEFKRSLGFKIGVKSISKVGKNLSKSIVWPVLFYIN